MTKTDIELASAAQRNMELKKECERLRNENSLLKAQVPSKCEQCRWLLSSADGIFHRCTRFYNRYGVHKVVNPRKDFCSEGQVKYGRV